MASKSSVAVGNRWLEKESKTNEIIKPSNTSKNHYYTLTNPSVPSPPRVFILIIKEVISSRGIKVPALLITSRAAACSAAPGNTGFTAAGEHDGYRRGRLFPWLPFVFLLASSADVKGVPLPHGFTFCFALTIYHLYLITIRILNGWRTPLQCFLNLL